jgi:hypothetical protein
MQLPGDSPDDALHFQRLGFALCLKTEGVWGI